MERNDIILNHWQIFLRLCVDQCGHLFPCYASLLDLSLSPIFSFPRFEIRNGNSLRLFRVKDQDEGTYTCTSENSVGKTEASAMLQVHGEETHHAYWKQACTHTWCRCYFLSSALCVYISASLWVAALRCCQELILTRMDYAIWQMFGRCALTHCQRAVPALIRHDCLSLSLSVSLSPSSPHLTLSAPFFISLHNMCVRVCVCVCVLV